MWLIAKPLFSSQESDSDATALTANVIFETDSFLRTENRKAPHASTRQCDLDGSNDAASDLCRGLGIGAQIPQGSHIAQRI